MQDIIIIGAGPAGLSAAINTAHRGLKTLVIEQYERPGGQPLIFYPDKIIKDHPGFPIGILAKEFSRRIEMQAINAGAKINCGEEALVIKKIKDAIIVKTSLNTYKTKRLIICTGMLNIPNRLPVLSEYKGEGVNYKLENINNFKDKKIAVIGGGDNAFDTAMQIKDVNSEVSIIVKEDYAKAKKETVILARKKGIHIHYNSELKGIINKKDSKKISEIILFNNKTKKEMRIKADEIFSSIGFSPVETFLKNNGIRLNKDGTVKVNDNYETNIKGVFAAGDLNGEAKLIAVACARGIQAALSTFSSIKKPYWIN